MGGGKSVWLVNEGIQLSLDYPGNVGFIGRWEYGVFQRTTLVTLLRFLDPKLIYKHSTNERYIELINGSIIYYGGFKPSQRVNPIDRLKSMDLGWFGIDEASETPEDVFLVLASRLRLPIPYIHYRGLLTSNPEDCWLNDRFLKKDLPNHEFIQALPKENPHNPSDYEQNLRDIFPQDWIDRYIDGAWQFDSSRDNYVFTYNMIDSVFQNDVSDNGKTILSVDVSRGGKDETTMIYRKGNLCELIYARLGSADSMETVGIIGNTIVELNPDITIIDSVGLGGPMFDRLKEVHSNRTIIPFVGGQREGVNTRRYLNLRAERYWNMKQQTSDYNLKIVDKTGTHEKQIRSQMTSIKYNIRSDMVIQIMSKEEMRSNGIPSPDIIDGVMQTCFDIQTEKRKGRIFLPSENWSYA